MIPRRLFLSIGLTPLLLAGCFWSIGGGEQKTTIEHTTGEQLIDLKRALDVGAITSGEYEKLRHVYLGK